ncbi:MAG TPA: SDR family NAD(P)-dependent oxidoreductase [Acidimicrobiales bacterium]|nr:SDR family NAD(P)-dependent oxidoreductase [Acidimicrobiales bacterium]
MENAFGQPQSVVVLGGTSDIARALTRRLCAQRARAVVLAGRDPDALAEAEDEAKAAGAWRTATVAFDATDLASAGPCVDAAFAAAGEVDLVVVAVGHLGHQEQEEDDPVLAARAAAVNFAWPVAALAAVRARLVAQGHGRVVVLSTLSAVRVRRSLYLYAGAKAGLDRVCQGMAESLKGTGVSLHIVRPAFVHSKMTAGRPVTPFASSVDAVADAVVAGLAVGAPVIWCPPALRYVALVLRVLPTPLWRIVAARA